MNSMKRQNDRIPKEELPRSLGAQYATGDQWRNNSRMNEGMEPKQKQYPVVDVTGDRSKVWCCKEQYCIGIWNVRSMNQGKLEVVKQEMARVNVDILGISELKWTGMGEFNSNEHYIYNCGQESLRRNGVAIMVNKSLKCRTWMQSQKWQNDLCSFPKQTIQYHSNPLEKEMATHSGVLAWGIPGTGEPGGLLSMGSHRVGHDWSDLAAAATRCSLTSYFCIPFPCNEKGIFWGC